MIIDEFAYGVMPERVDTLSTLFTIDINIHGFTLRTHLLSTYEVRNMLKRPITLFKALCAFRIRISLIVCYVLVEPRSVNGLKVVSYYKMCKIS